MMHPAPRPAAPVARAVSIHRGHPGLRCSRAAVAALVRTLDTHAGRFRGGCPPGDLSLAFLTDTALAKLHADFLGDPTPTDVITFAGEPAAGTAGEICVSVDAAHRCSRKRGRRFSAELALYVVHGWLHLAGYDDLQSAKRRAMRAAERRALTILAAAGCLPVFRIA
jgi:probable rRNA maturation factor